MLFAILVPSRRLYGPSGVSTFCWACGILPVESPFRSSDAFVVMFSCDLAATRVWLHPQSAPMRSRRRHYTGPCSPAPRFLYLHTKLQYHCWVVQNINCATTIVNIEHARPSVKEPYPRLWIPLATITTIFRGLGFARESNSPICLI